VRAAAGKSKIRTLQDIGRGLRTGNKNGKLMVIDFTDETNPFLVRHARKRLQDYKREGCFNVRMILEGQMEID